MKRRVQVLADEDEVFPLLQDIVTQVRSMRGTRRLFILHYAGYAVAASTHNALTGLTLTSRISQGGINGSRLDMSLINDALKILTSTSQGLDILILLDCCCTAAAERATATAGAGARVELMTTTSAGGLSNSRLDGKTFTKHWCEAFEEFLTIGQPFNCCQIKSAINSNYNLEKCPATFALREGWGVPITFRAPPHSTTVAPTAALATQTVITALHVVEKPDSESLDLLIQYLRNALVEITVVAALPIPSTGTLLLLRIPLYLQEMLVLPRVSFILDKLVASEGEFLLVQLELSPIITFC